MKLLELQGTLGASEIPTHLSGLLSSLLAFVPLLCSFHRFSHPECYHCPGRNLSIGRIISDESTTITGSTSIVKSNLANLGLELDLLPDPDPRFLEVLRPKHGESEECKRAHPSMVLLLGRCLMAIVRDKGSALVLPGLYMASTCANDVKSFIGRGNSLIN